LRRFRGRLLLLLISRKGRFQPREASLHQNSHYPQRLNYKHIPNQRSSNALSFAATGQLFSNPVFFLKLHRQSPKGNILECIPLPCSPKRFFPMIYNILLAPIDNSYYALICCYSIGPLFFFPWTVQFIYSAEIYLLSFPCVMWPSYGRPLLISFLFAEAVFCVSQRSWFPFLPLNIAYSVFFVLLFDSSHFLDIALSALGPSLIAPVNPQAVLPI